MQSRLPDPEPETDDIPVPDIEPDDTTSQLSARRLYSRGFHIDPLCYSLRRASRVDP